MATELAQAYVTLVPSLKGAQKSIESQLSGVNLSKTGSSMGKSLASGLGSSLASGVASASKGIVAALGGIGGAVGAIAAQGGMSRALNLEKAQTMFKGLKLDWNDFADTIQKSVDGTAFTMDAAALSAAQLAAAGVSAGKDMEKALNGAVGVSATFGANLEDMGQIYSKVAAQGKLTGETIQQLSDRGINARAVLADALGKTSDEISDMVSKGEIDFDTFSTAMYKAFGDSAQAANETFSGSFANMKSALNKIGENFATPFMKNMIPVFNSVREALNSLRGAIEPLVPYFETAMGALSSVIVEKMGVIRDSLSAEKMQAGLDAIKAALESFRAKVSEVFGALSDIPAVQAVLDVLGQFGQVLSENSGKIAAVAGAIMGIGAAFGALSTVLSVIPGIGGLLGALSGGAATCGIFSGALSLIGSAASLLAGPLGIVVAVLGAVGAAVAYTMQTNTQLSAQLTQLATVIGGQLTTMLQTMVTWLQSLAAMVLPMIVSMAQMIAPVVTQIVTVLMQLTAAVLPILSQALTALMPIVQSILTTVAAVAQQILAAVLPVVTSILTAIQENMPQIMSVISTVMQGITSIIQTVWPQIQTVIMNAVSTIRTLIETYWPRIQAVIESVMSAIGNIISTLWPQIQGCIEAAMSAIAGIVNDYWPKIEAVATAAMDVIMTVVEAVWPAIQSIIETVMGVIQGVISTVTAAISGDWDGVWNGVKDTLQAIWDGMGNIVQIGIDLVSNLISTLPDKIMGFFANAGDLLFSAGEAIINGLLNGLKAAIGGVWDFVGGIANQIAALKGPLSYDKVLLVPAGLAIMDGLKNGLAKGFDRTVSPRVSAMGGEIADEMWTHGVHAAVNYSAGLASGTKTVASAVAGLGEEVKDAMGDLTANYRSRVGEMKQASTEFADTIWNTVAPAVSAMGYQRVETGGVYEAVKAVKAAGYDMEGYAAAVAQYNKEEAEWSAKMAESRKSIKQGYRDWRAEIKATAAEEKKLAAYDAKIAKAQKKLDKANGSSKKSGKSDSKAKKAAEKELEAAKAAKAAYQEKKAAAKDAAEYEKQLAEWQKKLKNGDETINQQYREWMDDNAALRQLISEVGLNATEKDLAEWWNLAEMKMTINDATDSAEGYSKTLDALFQKSNTFSDAGVAFSKGFVEKFISGTEDYQDALDKLGKMTAEEIQQMVDAYDDSERAARELELNQRSLWVNGLKATRDAVPNIKDMMLDYRETCLDVKEAVYSDKGLSDAFDKAGMSIDKMALNLSNMGMTMDQFKSKYDSMVSTVSNGFSRMSRESQTSAADWAANLRNNMAESQAFADNVAAVMAKIPESVDSEAFRKAIMDGGYSQFGQMMMDMANMSADQVAEMVGLFNESIVEGQQSAIEQFDALSMGAQYMQAMVDGIAAAQPVMDESVAATVEGMTLAFQEHVPELTAVGAECGTGVADGAIQACGSKTGEFVGVGVQCAAGIARGIDSQVSAIAASAAAAVSAAIAAAKAAADINSPSRVMEEEVGKMLGAGAAVGIGESARTVARAMDDMMDQAVSAAYGKGLGDFAPNVSATALSERKVISYTGGDLIMNVEVRDGYDSRKVAKDMAREYKRAAEAMGLD